ncbi:MAG: hypothetical protein HZT40_10170 [Candidatus Thiothrix singaporensis]|uniref:Uncharacterized protein n=1 Tax=Candidatus Thiothrix singaporensis TaxID=2799669 RepID=A0A7L6ARZ9_9GAMM|nr:MAG: hypothetical protein HZT40_10170 [Candidatus Thiothrix singaporensis]
MLGLPLAYEMALVAALACLISWLMGRALCKSKEHEERAAKQSLQTTNDHLDALLAQKTGNCSNGRNGCGQNSRRRRACNTNMMLPLPSWAGCSRSIRPAWGQSRN